MDFQFGTEVTNVLFEHREGKKIATAIECRVNGAETGISSDGKGSGVRDQRKLHGGHHLRRPASRAERRRGGEDQRLLGALEGRSRSQDPSFGRPGKILLGHREKTNWESAHP